MFSDRTVILVGRKGKPDRIVYPLPALQVHAGHHLTHLAANGDVRYRDVMIPLSADELNGSTRTHHFQRVRNDRLRTVRDDHFIAR